MMPVQVYFIGAGPGDVELLTIKGKRIIEQADVIIYADSLVNPEICSLAKQGAEIYGSAKLCLEEITEIILHSVAQGKVIARIHSGDPAIFGALLEQMAILENSGISYEVVPGVSSVFAAAAALQAELTAPDISQTVIISRITGRTKVPRTEKLSDLASHQATLVLFLSVTMIEEVVRELISGGYSEDTPTAVVYKASWKDEIIVRSTLKEVAEKVRAYRIQNQALILVGKALDPQLKAQGSTRSKLYER